MSKINYTGSGIGVSWILTATFIVLKLTEVIAWKWIWVFSPIWIPVIAIIGVIILTFIVGLIYGATRRN